MRPSWKQYLKYFRFYKVILSILLTLKEFEININYNWRCASKCSITSILGKKEPWGVVFADFHGVSLWSRLLSITSLTSPNVEWKERRIIHFHEPVWASSSLSLIIISFTIPFIKVVIWPNKSWNYKIVLNEVFEKPQ